jgi:hypothetical protein
MKKLRMMLLLCFFPTVKTFSQTAQADKILGVWLSEDKTGKSGVFITQTASIPAN